MKHTTSALQVSHHKWHKPANGLQSPQKKQTQSVKKFDTPKTTTKEARIGLEKSTKKKEIVDESDIFSSES